MNTNGFLLLSGKDDEINKADPLILYMVFVIGVLLKLSVEDDLLRTSAQTLI